jgi:cytochrome c peroxidase
MWNSRFNAPSGNPFDNSSGFVFPPRRHNALLPAAPAHGQAFIPPTERVEAAGFHFLGTTTTSAAKSCGA